MKVYEAHHSIFGNMLFAEKGKIKLGVPLDFGLRISYLSFDGGDNLFFEQPNDMTDLSTPDGWRVRGGHRLWLAPESRASYYPDNEPITYEVSEDGIIIKQSVDPWLRVEKSMQIIFLSDGSIEIIHKIKNTDTEVKRFSVWGVTSLDGGGTEYIPLNKGEGGYNPLYKMSLWDYTSLGDERVTFSRDLITINHKPTGENFKLGIGHPLGATEYVNHGVSFSVKHDIMPEEEYPDGGVSFETYMCDHILEMETLSPMMEVKAGETVAHSEIWSLCLQRV